MSTSDGKEEEKKPFGLAMVEAAVKIVCEEKGLEIPKDIDELAKFIVSEKGVDYGYWTISRPDHLPGMIADFLGVNLLCEKFTDESNKKNVVVVVKIGSNFYQVDFRDFYEKNAQCLNVTKLDKCDKEPRYEYSPSSFTDEPKIKNILKDFEEHKSNKEKQGLEEVKKNDNMIQTSTHISKKLYNKLLNQRKDAHFLDCLFGRWPKEYYDVNDRNVISEKGANYTKFHACTQPAPSFHK